MRRLLLLLVLIPMPALAASDRATPGDVGSVSLMYGMAALCLLLMLAGVQWLVRRR